MGRGADLLSSARIASRCIIVVLWATRSFDRSLSFSVDSFLRMSTSLLRILSFSRISAQLWFAACMHARPTRAVSLGGPPTHNQQASPRDEDSRGEAPLPPEPRAVQVSPGSG